MRTLHRPQHVAIGAAGLIPGPKKIVAHNGICSMLLAPLMDFDSNTIWDVSIDVNGNYVVQMAIVNIPSMRTYICQSLSRRIVELSTHRYGCHVAKTIVRYANHDDKMQIREQIERDGLQAHEYTRHIYRFCTPYSAQCGA